MSSLSFLPYWISTYPYHIVTGLAFLYVVSLTVTQGRRRNPNHLPFPPGPRGYPIIGNLLNSPTDKPWLVYDMWAKTYGDMVFVQVMGQPFLVLSNLKRTSDLFEKRSTNYSDRMHSPMAIDLMQWGFNMAFIPYGQWWRRHRRAFHEYFHLNAVLKYRPVQTRETKALLCRLLQSPEDFSHHIRHTFAATILNVAYGLSVEESNDPYIANAEVSLEGLTEAAIPGRFLVDVMPILKHIPSWVPGAGFQKRAALWRKANRNMWEKPFLQVRHDLAQEDASSSVAASMIGKLPDKDHPSFAEEEKIAQNVAAVAYVAGSDTTPSTVLSFVLAMAMHPEVQKQAQAEIDEVVGPNRLPNFDDRESLPYINALVKESKRWQPVGPLGFPHMSSADDEYDGYFIPKGTIVMGNVWSILHDSDVYADPLEFRPERFLKDGRLDPSVRDPDCAAFGFGRRICPGRYMSDDSLYTIVSSVLAVFDIQTLVDDKGNRAQLTPDVTSGLISVPKPFKCVITPRSPSSEVLIRDSIE